MARRILIQFGLTLIFLLESSTTNDVSADAIDHQPNMTSADQQIRVVPTSSPNFPDEISKKIEKNSRQATIRSKQRATSPAAKKSQRSAIPTTRLPKLFNTPANNRAGPQHSIANGTETGLAGRSFSYGGNYGGGGYSNTGASSAGSGYMYGGGGSAAGGGNLMYFSNFDTALTTLAFLSFGVFLLNMIFSFLNMNNGTGGGVPLGPALGGRTDNATLREKRELLSAPILLALNAIQNEGWTARQFGSEKNGDAQIQRNCHFLTFCSIQMNPFYRQQLREILTDLIKRSDDFKRDKALNKISHRQIGKFYQAKRLLESGTCAKILDECANVFNPSTRAPR